MPEDFQNVYHTQVFGPIIHCLDDPVPRVQSHACAALTNFVDHCSIEILLPHLQLLSQKLCRLIETGISLVKENATSTIGSVAEIAKEHFLPYYGETITFLTNLLYSYTGKEYKQFRGQVIEAITLISLAVGYEAFAPFAKGVIEIMLNIQNTQLVQKDAQRLYLLSAWQRICIIMKEHFAPYLPAVLPSLLSMATLNPQMGISG